MIISRLTERLGHRGVWLAVLGSIWIVFGCGLLLNPETPAPGAIHQLIPVPVRACMWVASGATALVVGLRGKGGDDSMGHVALCVMPGIRCLSYFGSYLAWLLWKVVSLFIDDVPPVGFQRGWYPFLIWLLIVAMLRLVAAWPNRTQLPMPPPPEHR